MSDPAKHITQKDIADIAERLIRCAVQIDMEMTRVIEAAEMGRVSLMVVDDGNEVSRLGGSLFTLHEVVCKFNHEFHDLVVLANIPLDGTKIQ